MAEQVNSSDLAGWVLGIGYIWVNFHINNLAHAIDRDCRLGIGYLLSPSLSLSLIVSLSTEPDKFPWNSASSRSQSQPQLTSADSLLQKFRFDSFGEINDLLNKTNQGSCELNEQPLCTVHVMR